jgi:SAM-dependent MidA family methyltransferase
MSNMRQIIEQEVARQGIISFARFMELALYCPNFGYYERQDVTPGQRGDFYTSVSVGSLFGEMLAFQFGEWLEEMGPGHYQIVEAGAHDGRLAGDILGWLQKHRPEILQSIEYWILEPSMSRKESQRTTLGNLARHIRWFDSWETVPQAGVRGIVFSNELLDAMPVHRLGWDAIRKKWFEWGVTLEEGAFVWTKMPENKEPNVSDFLGQVPHELLEVLPDGFTTEACPAAIQWWHHAARTLRQGRLMAIDYGLSAEEFFTPERRNGTLRAYYRHHQSNELLANVGEQDLTAHTNFTAIQEAGERAGLKTEGLFSQAQFLTRILATASGKEEEFGRWNSSQVRQFQTLTHPEHLGQSFRVLSQSR